MVIEKKELWYEMLTSFCRAMHYENGITLPNMIGAYHIYDPSIDLSSSQCVIRVFNDITASHKDTGVLIQKCRNINNYVLSVHEGHIQLPKLNRKIFLGLYEKELQQHNSNINELAEHLYNLHYREITSLKFSITNNVWLPFANAEIKHINDIIQSL